MSQTNDAIRRVLIVEDDAWVSRVIERVFSKAGYETRVAPNGEHALREIDDAPFDVMIADINMPRLDGRQLFEALFSSDRKVPGSILVVTSQSGGETRHWFERFPGVELQEKPISPRALLRWVENRLGETHEARRAA